MHAQTCCKGISCTTQQCCYTFLQSFGLQIPGSSQSRPACAQHRGSAGQRLWCAPGTARSALLHSTAEVAAVLPSAGTAHTGDARIMRSIKSCTNLWHLQHHLEGLDHTLLNSRHLAAALVHAAQLHSRQQVHQSGVQPLLDSATHRWCVELARQAVSCHHLAKHQPRQLSNMLWALARLGLITTHPQQAPQDTAADAYSTAERTTDGQPIWDVLMEVLGRHLQQSILHRSAQAKPGVKVRSIKAAAVPLADCVQALHACALAGRSPSEQWLSAVLHVLQPQLQVLSFKDAATLAHALAVLRCPLPSSWVSGLLVSTRPLLCQMSSEQLASLVWATPALLQAASASQQHVDEAGSHHQPAVQVLLNCSSSNNSTQQQQHGQEWEGRREAHLEAEVRAWQQQVLEQLTQRGGLPGAQPADVSALLWGLAQMHCAPTSEVTEQLLQQASHGLAPASTRNRCILQSLNTSHTQGFTGGMTPAAEGFPSQAEQSQSAITSTMFIQPVQPCQWANIASALAQLQHTPPPGWVDAAASAVLQSSRALQQPPAGTLQDIAGLLSAAARLKQPPAPGVMNAALATATHAAHMLIRADSAASSSLLPSCTQIIWSLARLGFLPDRRLLHDLVFACVLNLNQQQAGQHQAENWAMLAVDDTDDDQLKHVAQLLWSLAVLEQSAQRLKATTAAAHQKQHTEILQIQQQQQAQVAAQAVADTAAQLSADHQLVQQEAGHVGRSVSSNPMQADTAGHAQHVQPRDANNFKRQRQPLLLLQLEQLQQLLQHVTGCLARSRQPAPIMAELVWALSQLSSPVRKTTVRRQQSVPVQLPLELRQQLLSSVALACPQLSLSHFVACVTALPGCGCVRRWDHNSQLQKAACTALLHHLPHMTPYQIRLVLQGLSEMGYNLPKKLMTRQLLPQLLTHQQLWQPHSAKVLLDSLPALTRLGLLQLKSSASPSAASKVQDQQQQQQQSQADSPKCCNHSSWQQDSADVMSQLRTAWLAAVLHPQAVRGYTTKHLTQAMHTCSELGWEPTALQWRTLYAPAKLHQLLKQCSAQDAVDLLWALASFQACNKAGQTNRSAQPPQTWVQTLAKHIMGDLNALSGVDVAHLICALAYLRYEEPGSNWATALFQHLELRSALLKKAEHAAIRDAWGTLGKCQRQGRRRA